MLANTAKAVQFGAVVLLGPGDGVMHFMKQSSYILYVLFWLGLVLLYLGFYFPDPYYYNSLNASGLRFFLGSVRFLGGLGLVLMAVALVLLKTGRLKLELLVLSVSALLVSLLAAAGCIGLWDSLKANTTPSIHPFLQLPPPILESQREATKIVFLGGSTTAWANSRGVGWPDLVEQKLRISNPQLDLLVLNAAKEWYTTQHSLINFVTNVSKLKPEVLVLSHGINDLLQNADFSYLSQGPFQTDYGHFLGPLGDLVKRNGTLHNFATKLLAAWYHRKRAVVDSDFPGLETFSHNIRMLARLAKELKIKFVLMTQPTVLAEGVEDSDKFYMLHFEAVGPKKQWALETAVRGMALYNQKTRDLATELDVQLIDLEPVVPKTFEYFTDEVHYQDRAFPLIAETVASQLKLEARQ